MWQDEGFLKAGVNVSDSMQQLTKYIEELPLWYEKITEKEILRKPAQNKWSKQEILGHLIDSAINNLKRFTEIQFSPQPYIVQSYNQDKLVVVNNYQNVPLDHLLSLWQSLNRQIIFAVKNIPSEKLNYAVNPQYNNNEVKTLEWLICDYVAHLQHHLQQVFGHI